jgi:hypothetical protein
VSGTDDSVGLYFGLGELLKVAAVCHYFFNSARSPKFKIQI